jgi:hypothetical protein
MVEDVVVADEDEVVDDKEADVEEVDAEEVDCDDFNVVETLTLLNADVSSYTESPFDPPQISVALPLQAWLQRPSVAGAELDSMELPQ